jgi:MATE family multidrug resistance protein
VPTRQLPVNLPRPRGDAPAVGQLREPLIGWLITLAPVLVTTLLVGQFSVTALLGAGSALVLFATARLVGLRPIHAAEAQIRSALVRARARGSQADYQVRDLVRGSLALATCLGVGGGLVLVGAASTISRLGESSATAVTAGAMLLGLAPTLTPSLWFAALARCAAALHRPRVALWAGIPSAFAIIGSEWALHLAHGGALTGTPARVAASVGLAYLLGCALIRTLARRDPTLAPVLSLAGWRASWLVIRRLLHLTRPRWAG